MPRLDLATTIATNPGHSYAIPVGASYGPTPAIERSGEILLNRPRLPTEVNGFSRDSVHYTATPPRLSPIMVPLSPTMMAASSFAANHSPAQSLGPEQVESPDVSYLVGQRWQRGSGRPPQGVGEGTRPSYGGACAAGTPDMQPMWQGSIDGQTGHMCSLTIGGAVHRASARHRYGEWNSKLDAYRGSGPLGEAHQNYVSGADAPSAPLHSPSAAAYAQAASQLLDDQRAGNEAATSVMHKSPSLGTLVLAEQVRYKGRW
jgi:hypothetical protein